MNKEEFWKIVDANVDARIALDKWEMLNGGVKLSPDNVEGERLHKTVSTTRTALEAYINPIISVVGGEPAQYKFAQIKATFLKNTNADQFWKLVVEYVSARKALARWDDIRPTRLPIDQKDKERTLQACVVNTGTALEAYVEGLTAVATSLAETAPQLNPTPDAERAGDCTYLYFKESGKWAYHGRGLFPKDGNVDRKTIWKANGNSMPGIIGDGSSYILIVVPDHDCTAQFAYPRMLTL